MAPYVTKGFALLLVIFIGFSFCQNVEDQNYWSESETTEFGAAKATLTDTLLSIDTTKNLRNTYQTNTNQKAFVLDNLLNNTMVMIIRGYLTVELGGWKFSLYEPYEGGKETPSDNIPWVNELDCIKFGNSLAGRTLQKAVMDVSGSETTYYPYSVKGKILRRGDVTKLHQDAEEAEDEYSLMMFLNEKWLNNDYGELYLYDKDKEIFGGAVPKYGRSVIWQSSISYLSRPPSMAFKKGLFLLHIQFTKNKDKVFQGLHKYELTRAERIAVVTGDFVGANKPPPPSIDIQSKVVASYETKDGKKIFVLDDLFDKKDLDQLRVVILRYGLYYYDDSEAEDSDNVVWIAGFSIDSYIKSRLWSITHKVASHVSGTTKWFPYDVSCNLIRNADHTRIHNDCNSDEEEWTFLIYLNPGMTKNDYGETVFYESDTNNPEIAAEVRPKYGRAVIFQGIIPHSARPPSTNYTYARLTFVAKLSVNELVGRTKAFNEEMRHFTGVRYQQLFIENRKKGVDLMQTMKPKKKSKYSSDKTTEFDQNEEEEEFDPDGDDKDEPEQRPPQEPQEQSPVSQDEEEPEIDDTQVQQLQEKLEAIENDSKPSLTKLRALHRELSASHSLNRDLLRKDMETIL